MPQYDIEQQKYIERNNTRFDVNMAADADGDLITAGNPAPVKFGDSASVDAFSRLRVSNPHSVFEASFIYGLRDHIFHPVPTLGGTITENLAEASLSLNVTSTIGSKMQHFSTQRINYQPGRSMLCVLTGNFEGHEAGITKRIGLFDDDDGLFFYSDGTQFGACIRTSTSGTAAENSFPQSSWNLDKMDGTGAYRGPAIDPTKAHIFIIDFQWLGVGRVRFGLDIDGIVYYVHEVNHANIDSIVYMANPNLFLAYEIENISSGVGGTMKQICCAAFSEGGYEKRGVLRSASTDNATVLCANGVLTPIISIRPALLVNGKPNKATMIALNIDILNADNVNSVHWTILEDATIYTDATEVTPVSFTSHDSVVGDSIAETHVGTPAVGSIISTTPTEAGRAIMEGFAPSGGVRGSTVGSDDIGFVMVIPPDGHRDTITLAAMGLGGSANVRAAISWREIV